MALAVFFAVQFQTTHFRIWRYDAETRQLVEELNRRGARAGRTLTAGISWLLQPSVVFYQTTLDLKWMHYAVQGEMRAGLDVYWLAREDMELVEKYGLRIVRRNELSQIVIAEPAARTLPD